MRTTLRALVFAIALLAVSGGAADAQMPRWLSHYQRGERQMEQGQYQDAALSFLKAIREKGQDNERERVSGMRVVPYFPHRELGICLSRLGIRDFAAEELRLSIRQSPSQRAQSALRELEN